NAVAPSSDGVTIAIAGWSPSLRIAKALPWTKLTRRDGDFYSALDDLWAWTVRATRSFAETQEARAADAEILGDVELRRGQPVQAVAHYDRAIEIRQRLVRGDTSKVRSQYLLAATYEKRLAVADAIERSGGSAVLTQAAEFWQQLIPGGRSIP